MILFNYAGLDYCSHYIMWYIITSKVLLLLLFWCIFSLMKKSLQLPDPPNCFHSSLESFSSSCGVGSSLTLPTTTCLQMATPGLAPGKSARKSVSQKELTFYDLSFNFQDRERPPTDVQLSKFLSYICRHGAEKRGLTVHEGGARLLSAGALILFLYLHTILGGYINVCDILELREARKNSYSVSDVQRVVSDCPKQRFSLRTAAAAGGGGDTLQICANQGHSVEVRTDQQQHKVWAQYNI